MVIAGFLPSVVRISNFDQTADLNEDGADFSLDCSGLSIAAERKSYSGKSSFGHLCYFRPETAWLKRGACSDESLAPHPPTTIYIVPSEMYRTVGSEPRYTVPRYIVAPLISWWF